MKFEKIITILTIILLFSNTVCFATGQVITDWYKPGKLTGEDYNRAFQLAGIVVDVITTVGITVAIIGIMIIGIKYMIGSVEQKAEYKKTMIPYIVGCVLIFTITEIVSIIYELVTKM